jgi:hypothetical protein
MRSYRLDITKLTARLGIQPTNARNTGDVVESGKTAGLIRDCGVWRFTTERKIDSDDPLPHIEYLLKLLEPQREIVAAIALEMDAVRFISIWWNAQAPTAGYSLPAPMAARLCTLCDRIDLRFTYNVDKEWN